MKNINLYRNIIFATIAATSISAYAGTATIPNTFSAGAKAVASEVNENFTAIKDAIDDNDTRINSLSAGFVSISPAAFHYENDNTCDWIVSGTKNYGYFGTDSPDNCIAIAPVELPHNANITTVTCRFYDFDAGGEKFNGFRLSRHNMTSSDQNENYEIIYSSNGTGAASGGAIEINSDSTASVAGGETIDNETYFYQLRILISETDTTGASLSVHGCSIGYE